MAIRTFLYSGAFGADFFQESEDHAQGLVRKALVAVEGAFKDSKGTEHVFSQERLNTIAEHTNRALGSGVDIPVCTDHQKTVANTVGNFGEGAEAFTKMITAEDLPNAKATHLIGKMGLFVNNVVLSSLDAIEKVKNKVVTSVSMGLNLDKNDHRIMELSLVPIPAIPNMGLFSVGNNGQAFTWEELERNEQSIEDLKEDYTKLTDQLWTLINNVYTDESIDIANMEVLKQYLYTALNGFSVRALDLLGVKEEEVSGTPEEDAATQTADAAVQQASTQRQDMASPSAASYSKYTRQVAMFARAKKYSRTRNASI